MACVRGAEGAGRGGEWKEQWRRWQCEGGGRERENESNMRLESIKRERWWRDGTDSEKKKEKTAERRWDWGVSPWVPKDTVQSLLPPVLDTGKERWRCRGRDKGMSRRRGGGCKNGKRCRESRQKDDGRMQRETSLGLSLSCIFPLLFLLLLLPIFFFPERVVGRVERERETLSSHAQHGSSATLTQPLCMCVFLTRPRTPLRRGSSLSQQTQLRKKRVCFFLSASPPSELQKPSRKYFWQVFHWEHSCFNWILKRCEGGGGPRSFNFPDVFAGFYVARLHLRSSHFLASFFWDEIQLHAGEACSYTAKQRECLPAVCAWCAICVLQQRVNSELEQPGGGGYPASARLHFSSKHHLSGMESIGFPLRWESLLT